MALVLVVVEGADLGRTFDVTGDAVVGRDPTAALQLTDQEVSRRHAIVSPAPGGAAIEDLGSSNGTWIGDDRVNGTAKLALGQRMRVGSTILELQEGEPTGEQPVVAGEADEPPSTKVPLPDWREASPERS